MAYYTLNVRSRGKQLVLFSLMFPETKYNGSKNTEKKPLERRGGEGGWYPSPHLVRPSMS